MLNVNTMSFNRPLANSYANKNVKKNNNAAPLKKESLDSADKISFGKFISISRGNKGSKIALINLNGPIADSSKFPLATETINAIKKVKEEGIKALVFRINSPGGTVGASQEINYALNDLRDSGTKVVASFGDIAASGGVYVGVASDKIVSNPGTLTGSIGVIMHGMEKGELYKKIGISPQVVKAGKFKDIFSGNRPMTEAEKEVMENVLLDTHQQFIEAVADGRNLPVEEVEKFADGRIFTGRQALDYKLVDTLGPKDEAINSAAKLAGITVKPKVVDFTPKQNFSLKKIIGIDGSDALEQLGINAATSSDAPFLYYFGK